MVLSSSTLFFWLAALGPLQSPSDLDRAEEIFRRVLVQHGESVPSTLRQNIAAIGQERSFYLRSRIGATLVAIGEGGDVQRAMLLDPSTQGRNRAIGIDEAADLATDLLRASGHPRVEPIRPGKLRPTVGRTGFQVYDFQLAWPGTRGTGAKVTLTFNAQGKLVDYLTFAIPLDAGQPIQFLRTPADIASTVTESLLTHRLFPIVEQLPPNPVFSLPFIQSEGDSGHVYWDRGQAFAHWQVVVRNPETGEQAVFAVDDDSGKVLLRPVSPFSTIGRPKNAQPFTIPAEFAVKDRSGKRYQLKKVAMATFTKAKPLSLLWQGRVLSGERQGDFFQLGERTFRIVRAK